MNKLFKKIAIMASAGTLLLGTLPATVQAEEAPWTEERYQALYTAPADPSLVTTNAIPGWPKGSDITSTAGVVMDADTGTILYAKNMDQQLFPASVTKIMTSILALEQGGDLNAPVTMTQTGVDYAVSGSANLYTRVGEVFTLKDLLYGTLLASANDMATQIGEYVGGGSLEHFVDMMNQRAKELGCTNTNFHNACGMPDELHHTTAHDLALIMQDCLKNPTFREIIHTHSYTIPATNMTAARTFGNHHPMLVNQNYVYDGIIGGKTGYTDAAQHTLATAVERDGRTLICVTLQAKGMDQELRDQKHLLDFGFSQFQKITPDQTGDQVLLDAGNLILPSGVKLDQLDARQNEDGSTEYFFAGQNLGSATLQSPAVSTAEEPAVSENASSVSGNHTATVSGNESRSQSEQVTILGHTANRNAVLAIGILGGLVLLGIILIVVISISRRS